MSLDDFAIILGRIEGKIAKTDTNFRECVPASVRLAITLRFLASGDSYGSLMYLFRVSKPTISLLVPEVCRAIVEALQEYVKMPENEEQWLCESKKFEEKWDFPHAVGAIDGKHVAIQCPPKSGSEYFNYKSFFSFVLFALVDADYNFMFVDVGCQGRISDGGVFKNSLSCTTILKKGNLKLPPPSPLPNSSIPSPYVILGDDAFCIE
ncbi:uncharacterized protein LOC124358292 [Homalodisca vitripennis]|uniref:uncharacterized protein LOC124358292 n=1 Tax=Homalodisca vitripennis TaxID=197043 RepID=UPI001EEAF8B1|nr:uncharacterized protein LOC124358292 [Homalodisca vitripennis]